MRNPSDVQSLVRGLRVLDVLNERPGIRASEIASICSLPRTSVYRMLRTLVARGLVWRSPDGYTYFPGRGVLRLSAGYGDEAALVERARARLAALAPVLRWPLYFMVPRDGVMCIEAATDHVSPLAVQGLRAGTCVPLLECAAGIAWLAAVPDGTRATCMAAALRNSASPSFGATPPSDMMEAEIETARRRGFAMLKRPHRFTAMVGIGVPVSDGRRVLGAVSIRFAERALPVARGIEQFVPALREATEFIATDANARAHALAGTAA